MSEEEIDFYNVYPERIVFMKRTHIEYVIILRSLIAQSILLFSYCCVFSLCFFSHCEFYVCFISLCVFSSCENSYWPLAPIRRSRTSLAHAYYFVGAVGAVGFLFPAPTNHETSQITSWNICVTKPQLFVASLIPFKPFCFHVQGAFLPGLESKVGEPKNELSR